MVFPASHPRHSGKLDHHTALPKLYPVNMNINSAANRVGKAWIRPQKWKNKAYGNPNIHVSAMAVPRFDGPLHPQIQTSFPVFEPSFMFHAPSADSRRKARGNGMVKRNRLKKRRIVGRKKINSTSLHAPLAPRNTTSFIMRAKKHGGIASAITPSPVTSAVLPTCLLSPGIMDKGSEEMNKELGVNGYGSMNGLIRLRSPRDGVRDGASEMKSDVEQGESTNQVRPIHSVEQLEQRIDEGLSRFEMIYPSLPPPASSGTEPRSIEDSLNNREWLIDQLEEENLTLRERVFFVEHELNELRRRFRDMEGLNHVDGHMEEQCEESCGDVSAPCQ